ncbi:MAG: deoxyribose-phosphate aldolase [Elusimicrobiaceae bacterium]
MREEEISKVVGGIIKNMQERGAASPGAKRGVTTGSAGKVFASPLTNWKNATGYKDSGHASGHTCKGTCGSKGCQNCNPLTKMSADQFKNCGADRVSVCNPGSECSSVASMIDHTLLKANATQEEVGKLCADAAKYKFASVCVNPAYVSLSANLLKGSGVKVCTVIGFPLGSTTPTVKALEARDAIANGADEIDMVINVGALKSGNDALVFDDIRAVREATRGKLLKVIIETAYLTNEEKVRACVMAKQAQADFVKTSTGFGPGGATAEDVALMRKTVGCEMGVKASGGIRNSEDAAAMIKAGADRLGTSASVAIVLGTKTSSGGY